MRIYDRKGGMYVPNFYFNKNKKAESRMNINMWCKRYNMEKIRRRKKYIKCLKFSY